MVQCQQQNNKVRFGGLLRGEVAGASFGASGLGSFWVVSDGFCWLRVILDGFRSFAVLLVTSVSKHTEKLTLYRTHGRT